MHISLEFFWRLLWIGGWKHVLLNLGKGKRGYLLKLKGGENPEDSSLNWRNYSGKNKKIVWEESYENGCRLSINSKKILIIFFHSQLSIDKVSNLLGYRSVFYPASSFSILWVVCRRLAMLRPEVVTDLGESIPAGMLQSVYCAHQPEWIKTKDIVGEYISKI